jgi:hypothetical protein
MSIVQNKLRGPDGEPSGLLFSIHTEVSMRRSREQIQTDSDRKFRNGSERHQWITNASLASDAPNPRYRKKSLKKKVGRKK